MLTRPRNLKYFLLSDDKDALKSKFKKLAVQYHPDKNLDDQEGATKRMQEIKDELDYCMKRGRFVKPNSINKDEFYNVFDLMREAYSDFNSRKPKINDFGDLIGHAMLSFTKIIETKAKKYNGKPNK